MTRIWTPKETLSTSHDELREVFDDQSFERPSLEKLSIEYIQRKLQVLLAFEKTFESSMMAPFLSDFEVSLFLAAINR